MAHNGPSNFTVAANLAYKCLHPEERKAYNGGEEWKPLNCKLEVKKVFKDIEQKVIMCLWVLV